MSEPRFELLDSYARELDHDADLIVPPASAAHVRRIGRSRRTRRTVIAVVILVVVLLSIGATLVVSSAMTGDVPPWATAPSPTQASPAPTQTATTSASATPSAQTSVTTTLTPASTRTASATSTRTTSAPAASVGAVVTLPAPLELKSAADINAVAWMNGATKSFFVTELARVRAAAGCDDYLIVQAYRGTDLISGSTFGCDSAQITWGNLAGTWKVVFAGQAVPYCTEVRSSGWKSTIPQDFAGGQCYDAGGNVVAYTP